MKTSYYVYNRRTKEVRGVAFHGIDGSLISPHTSMEDDIPASEGVNWRRIPASSVRKEGKRLKARSDRHL